MVTIMTYKLIIITSYHLKNTGVIHKDYIMVYCGFPMGFPMKTIKSPDPKKAANIWPTEALPQWSPAATEDRAWAQWRNSHLGMVYIYIYILYIYI